MAFSYTNSCLFVKNSLNFCAAIDKICYANTLDIICVLPQNSVLCVCNTKQTFKLLTLSRKEASKDLQKKFKNREKAIYHTGKVCVMKWKE